MFHPHPHPPTHALTQMIRHSPTIATVLAVDGAALMLYNVAGMRVTGAAGAVFRTVLETSRTLFVWIVDLDLFYGGVGGGDLGESWTTWSLMQAAGFAIMVAGTLVYGRGDDAAAAAALCADGGEVAVSRSAVADAGDDGDTGIAGRASGTPTVAVAVRRRRPPASAPLGTPMSLRATMNIHSFSASYRGGSFFEGGAVSPQSRQPDGGR